MQVTEDTMKHFLNHWKWMIWIGVVLIGLGLAWSMRTPVAAQQSGNPSVRVEYEYDAANRLTGVNYSNGVSIQYTYDAAGNLLERKVSGGTPVETWQDHTAPQR